MEIQVPDHEVEVIKFMFIFILTFLYACIMLNLCTLITLNFDIIINIIELSLM
jgi:hypothetical protein